MGKELEVGKGTDTFVKGDVTGDDDIMCGEVKTSILPMVVRKPRHNKKSGYAQKIRKIIQK